MSIIIANVTNMTFPIPTGQCVYVCAAIKISLIFT